MWSVPRTISCCALFAYAAAGQQAPPSDSGVVIRSTTNLVQVHVVVEDSKGRPVLNLRQSDFQIQDDGKTQRITLFTPDRDAASTQPAAPSLSADASQESTGYSVIVLDWRNLKTPDRLFAQDQVVKLLKNYQPRQQVALYLLGRTPRFLHYFTSAIADLLPSIEEANVEYGAGEDAPPDRLSFDEQILYWRDRVWDTVEAFEQIENLLARAPGGKSLIWLSAGFPETINRLAGAGTPGSELDFLQDVERALARLNQAGITLYAVDAVGLTTTTRSYGGTLSELAQRTGGTAFLDRNDLDEGMKLALEDMHAGYTLGFHVPEAAAAGLHEIHIRVNRSGLKLRYRESYDWAAPSTK
jgi:VWFA-related protein